MNVYALLAEQARVRPEADAFLEWHGGRFRATSFRELDAASARAAGMLRSAGLRPGTPVLVLVPMSIDLYVALLAIFRLGLVAVFIDPTVGRAHIERCCRELPIGALIASPKAHLLRCTVGALRRIRLAFATGPLRLPGSRRWSDWRRADATGEPEEPCSADTPALVTFTSGSTGQPKAAMRTHGLLRAQQEILAAELGISEGDLVLSGLPMFVLCNLGCGAANLIPGCDLSAPAMVDAAALVERVRTSHASCLQGSPALFGAMAADCRRTGVLPDVRRVHTGGAPVFPRLLSRIRAMAPVARLTTVYGSTEAEPIACLDVDTLRAEDRAAMVSGRGLPAGRPVAAARVRLLPDRWGTPIGPFASGELDAVTLPAGQAGEIVVSGPHVIPGYLHGAGDAETKFRVGHEIWHRTGDAGCLDADGNLWLLGRCSAGLSDSGGTLYPFTVEAAADRHWAVRRSACCRVGGRRTLVIEPAVGSTGADWSELKRDLAWAGIERVVVVDRIPCDRRHNAKVDYPALHRRLERLSAGV